MNLKRKSLRAAMLTVGLAAVLSAGTGVASASTSGANGIGSGNQVSVPVTAPINVCGNSVAIIGDALAACPGGAAVTGGDRDGLQGAHTSGHNGVGSGNQVSVPVTAPINACGNAVAAIGSALAHCTGGASVSGDQNDALQGARTNGRHGVLSGNQAGVPVTAPVDVCGTAVAVVGAALAHCTGGASVSDGSGSDCASPYAAESDAAATRAAGTDTTLPIVGQLPTLPKLPIIGG